MNAWRLEAVLLLLSNNKNGVWGSSIPTVHCVWQLLNYCSLTLEMSCPVDPDDALTTSRDSKFDSEI